MSDSMIKVENVSMRFRMANDKLQSLKEYAIALAKRQLKYKDFWVFRDVAFEVKKGEVVGIIGRNGAGKSTLLKIIAGVLTPTEGKVTLNGNVVPMLELGSGFDIDLSGKENIFLNGSILGYSEEFIKEKYEQIVEFSGLKEFIEVPIRNYSSGMLMRLAFSIATIVQPEILIVDEILAVGDEAFQKKSKRKMLELMGGGTTVLFVSHSIDQIREMCNRVVWLEDGKVRIVGETKTVCDAYQEYINPPEKKEDIMMARSDAAKYFMDVLFVYGGIGENYYWRVAHQKEQLLAGNLCSSEIYADQLTADLTKKYRVFIFTQCSYTEQLEDFIRQAHELNKTILFDISYCSDKTDSYTNSMDCLEKIKSLCDGVIVSNAYLEIKLAGMGLPVYCNVNAACDRMEQLSQWAVYDREILPEILPEHLNDLELINYNKSVAEKKNRQQEGLRIGIFEKSSDTDKSIKIESLIKNVERIGIKVTFFVLKNVFTADWTEKRANVKEVSCMNREELERIYSSVDIQIAFLENEEEIDSVEQRGILSSLVKVPYLVCGRNDISYTGNEIISCADEKEIIEVLQVLLNDPKKRKQLGEEKYELVKKKYTAINCGNRFSEYIRQKMKKNVIYIVPHTKMESEMAALVNRALSYKHNGIDITFLNEEDADQDIFIGKDKLPVLSKTRTYIYGSIDTGIATAWNTFYFLQSYPNIGKRYYWIQGYEAERYSPGEFARFSCMQTYKPCIDVEFLSASESSRKWLENEYGRSSEPEEMYFEAGKQMKQFDSQKIRILIEGSRYYEQSELDEAFRITEQLDRDKYEIWYLETSASEKEWYSYDKKYQNVDYPMLMDIYRNSSVLLQTMPRQRYESAIQLMSCMNGISVAAGRREEAGKDCLIYEKGNLQMAIEILNKLEVSE